MHDLYIPPTAMTPEIDFRYSAHSLRIAGESYPENAAAFYHPPRASLGDYLDALAGQAVFLTVQLAYFNSASTRQIFDILARLNAYAASGHHVVLNWHHDEEDDSILELGNEMAADFTALDYRPCALA